MNYLTGVYYKKKCIIQHFCGDNFTHCVLRLRKVKGVPFIIRGPNGAGKTTICCTLLEVMLKTGKTRRNYFE